MENINPQCQSLGVLRGWLTLLALVLWLPAAGAAPLSLPFYDGIPGTYPLGTGGGSGAVWTLGAASTNIAVAPGVVLNYPALLATPGGGSAIAVTTAGTLQAMGVGFSPVTNGYVYASFLLQLMFPPAGSNTVCLAGLDGRSAYADSPELAVGLNAADQLVVGRRTLGTVSRATPALVNGQTYLVVVRYHFVGGSTNDTVDLWLNPGSAGVAESNVPSATIAGYVNPAVADATNLQAFYLVSPATAGGPAQWFLGDVRIGTNWAAVTPPDQPVAVIVTPDNANPSFMNLPGGSPVQFTVAGADQNGNLQTVSWYLNGVWQQTDTNLSGYAGTDTWSHGFAAAGTNTVQAVVENSAGCYSSPAASWTVTTVASQRGMYVDQLTNIVGNAAAESSVLQYALANQITYLALYVGSGKLTNTLSSFIQRAKTNYGIQQIGFVGQNTNDFNNYTNYNNLYAGKADVFNLEYEYWNLTPRDFDGYMGRLQYLNYLTTPLGLQVEAYVGWPSNSEITQIAGQVDRLLVHCYVTNPTNAYTYGWTNNYRWYYAGLATNRATLWPIFSCESSNYYSDQPFMGDWLAANSLNAAETNFMGSYARDTNALKYNAALLGFQYYSSRFMSPLLFLMATNESPTNLAANVSTGAGLTITMNAGVVKGAAGNVTIRQVTNNATLASIPIADSRITVSGNQASISPGTAFAHGTAYYVLIDATCFKGSSGAYFPGVTLTNAWTFTVP